MAITVETTPDLISAAWRRILFETSSTRYASTVKAVTGVSSGTGGFARYAVASNSYLVGDVVLGSAFTGTGVAYNVYQTVTVINASWFETDVLFVASGTGAGTMTRSNDNFQMKCQTYVFDDPKVSFTSVTDPGDGIHSDFVYGAAHGYVVGDIVSVADSTQYGGLFKVISLPSSLIIRLQVLYNGTDTGTTRSGRLIGTSRHPAVLISGQTRFQCNPSGHLQSVLTQDLSTSTSAQIITPNTNAFKFYGILFTEEFDNFDGFLTEYDYTFSILNMASRSVWQHQDTQGMQPYQLNVGAGAAGKFLTKSPLIQKIRIGEQQQLSFIVDVNESLRARIRKYDLGGVAMTVVNIDVETIVDNRGIIIINSDVFGATHSKFDVWLDRQSDGAVMSETRTFIIDKNNYQNPIRFYFENSLGGFDAYTATGQFKADAMIKKTAFRKVLNNGFSVSDRGTTNLGTKQERGNEVWTEFLSNAEALWLIELFASTNVFIRSTTDTSYIPVNVYNDTNNIYDSEKLTQLKISYTPSNQPLALTN